jgi:hypothetical protein
MAMTLRMYFRLPQHSHTRILSRRIAVRLARYRPVMRELAVATASLAVLGAFAMGVTTIEHAQHATSSVAAR